MLKYLAMVGFKLQGLLISSLSGKYLTCFLFAVDRRRAGGQRSKWGFPSADSHLRHDVQIVHSESLQSEDTARSCIL